jgi:hypothetical protein
MLDLKVDGCIRNRSELSSVKRVENKLSAPGSLLIRVFGAEKPEELQRREESHDINEHLLGESKEALESGVQSFSRISDKHLRGQNIVAVVRSIDRHEKLGPDLHEFRSRVLFGKKAVMRLFQPLENVIDDSSDFVDNVGKLAEFLLGNRVGLDKGR